MIKKINNLLKEGVFFVLSLRMLKTKEDFKIRKYEGEDAWVAAFSYIPLVSTAILVLRKDNSDFVLGHAKQALILSIGLIVVFLIFPVSVKIVVGSAILIIMIISGYLSFTGKRVYIPFITEISKLIVI